jgi:hypothetical protein
VQKLDGHAIDYEALFYAPLEHSRLNNLKPNARGYIAAISRVLGIEQIRPLMLAVFRTFARKKPKRHFS